MVFIISIFCDYSKINVYFCISMMCLSKNIRSMEKIIRACGLLLAMAVVVVLNSCFDSSVECIGCNGRGVFTFGDVSVQCKYCHGTGTITKELANSLMPEQEDYEDEEPINDGYYCNICMGTGKFRTNSFPFEGTCTMCNGRGVSHDNRFNSNQPLYRCVYCNGSGQNPFGGGQCTFCRGYGISLMTPSQQSEMADRQSKQTICGACHGTTACPVCKVTGGVDYGGIRYCSSCGNTGRCRWCYGRGIKSY